MQSVKVLSSGVIKGIASVEADAQTLRDPARGAERPDLWRGHRVRLLSLLDRANEPAIEFAAMPVVVASSCDGGLTLDRPINITPGTAVSYELLSGEEAPLAAIRQVLRLPLGAELPPLEVKLGTTRGTNALLTRRGARVAFVTTRGHGDVLRIGYQNRPKLFELAIRKPPPLFEVSLEIDERITADGAVLRSPDREQVRQQLHDLHAQGIEALAICLLHATANPSHERLVAEIAREIGFAEISISHEGAPLVRIVPRGDTTVVDAYLNPVLRRYIAALRRSLGENAGRDLRLLTSAGSLVAAEQFRGKDSLLSGPAGGVVGFARAAEAAGFSRAIGFDMGGTSTDVSRYDGRFELEYETHKAGVRIVAPMLAIETVAAGGGSICRFDGVKLVVGPESAGAEPGPACYGRGGPLTVTDVNLHLGRILPEHFPFPLDRRGVERLLNQLAGEVAAATGQPATPHSLAEGFARIASANMAQAVRTISVARGYDPREYVLVPFGGAGMQHACAVADELGMTTIVSPPDAGLLSAYGIGLADVVRRRTAGLYLPLTADSLAQLDAQLASLLREASDEVIAEGIAADEVEVRTLVEVRYSGAEGALAIELEPRESLATRFAEEHRRLFGYVQERRSLELVSLRIEAIGRSPTRLPASGRNAERRVFAPTEWIAAGYAVHRRSDLRPGDQFDGPAIVAEFASTAVIDRGWRAEVLNEGELLLERIDGAARDSEGAAAEVAKSPVAASPDPVALEIYHNRFAGIAEQMGVTLRQTASSVNVKERLDFSCALFTAAGDLVVNAPHIPVHLGAMSETVRSLLTEMSLAGTNLAPGDVIVTNDPYRGGSHLPDVTVVTPVHHRDTGELQFLVASRAHHAEIGGIRPGSMPPFSKNLAEEGVVLRHVRAIAAGESRLDALRDLLLAGPHPTRNVEDNLADIAAQIAANQQGVRDLEALILRDGWPRVREYMRHIQDAAERKTRAALARLPQGCHHFVDHLDDGSPIAVAVTLAGSSDAATMATIDFTGTGPVLAGNLNANRGIVTAAVLYVLRCLLEEEIPLNQGVLAPVTIVLPECLLNPPGSERPEDCPAVVGGNVETSQRVVDVLLGALGIAAASQGTMNNVLFGDATFGYYETICGGAGATPHAHGADAVHTHMTNTRLTDAEVLERRFPVLLREFAIRRGSGGAGERRGGDGVVRRIEFLRPLELSVLTSRRGVYPPYGLAGGSPGAIGRNLLVRRDGTVEDLGSAAERQVEPGDMLIVETPGGGGWGGLPHEE